SGTDAASECFLRVRRGAVEPDRDPGAAALGALGDDLAAVGLGYLPDDREPEARPRHRPRRTRPVEAIEDVRQVGIVDARAVIPDLDRAVGDADVELAARGGL